MPCRLKAQEALKEYVYFNKTDQGEPQQLVKPKNHKTRQTRPEKTLNPEALNPKTLNPQEWKWMASFGLVLLRKLVLVPLLAAIFSFCLDLVGVKTSKAPDTLMCFLIFFFFLGGGRPPLTFV